ncbi:MAG: DUF421 domain-containing protein [Clostridia bacterium]|nr:DUF421 domain-containing protein [Clostridia bacterium]
MFITLIRTSVLYIFVIAIMRLMGKRQIGELQPTELVVTLLLSEIIAIPMQDNDISLVSAIVPVLVLVGFEILISVISLKSVKIRNLMQGNSIIIIRDGKLDLKKIKELRFTIDDILEALRQKDIFDISKVQYAVVETNGTISVMLKPQFEPVTREDLSIKTIDSGIPCAVIVDGRIIKTDFDSCNMTMEKLKKIIKKDKINVDKTLLMTIDKKGNKTVIGKD